jgi:hypothetical protein
LRALAMWNATATQRLVSHPAASALFTAAVVLTPCALPHCTNRCDGAQAFRIPAVAMYALAFGFFKLVNYVLFFWLPFFLSRTFTPSTSNVISTLYDVGMMPGAFHYVIRHRSLQPVVFCLCATCAQ